MNISTVNTLVVGFLTLRLNKNDNLVIARTDIAPGTFIKEESLVAIGYVRAGHKLASRNIAAGETVYKNGIKIGNASVAIAAGEWVHGQNIELAEDLKLVLPRLRNFPKMYAPKPVTFSGFVRPDGQVGTRNYLGVFVTGNCAGTAARRIAEWFTPERLASYPNVDGVVPFVHEIGCGMEMTGEPMDLLRRTIGGSIRNPNIAAALVMALGCERNNIYGMMKQEKLTTSPTLRTLVLQEVGGTANAIEQGIAAINAMLPLANAHVRQAVSVEHLRVGLQSAAVDGFCAVSANPALGAAMDLLVAQGGTVVLSDTTDLASLGPAASTLAADASVADALLSTAHTWTEYQSGRDTAYNRRVIMDSATNKGLSNRLEKALAGIARAGSSPINGVLGYAHRLTGAGVRFMDAPSYEAVSATGQVAAGVNMVCLTTGGGSGFGAALVPTMKLVSNTPAYLRMLEDLDLDCGPILDGEVSVAQMGRRIFEQLLEHASGTPTCSEALGVGDNEFVPWPKGVLA